MHYDGIEGLQPRLPLGAALTIGVKGPSGAPTQTDRFHFVSPHDSMEGKFRVRPLLPQFAAFNSADASKRQMVRGNLIHSKREDCFAYHLRAQQLGGKWQNHPQKRPACTGDGHKATRFYGETPEDFREIECPNELCEFRQGTTKACKPFAQLLFRPRWPEGNPLPTPLTKLTTGSWNSTAALLGFFSYLDEQAAQLGLQLQQHDQAVPIETVAPHAGQRRKQQDRNVARKGEQAHDERAAGELVGEPGRGRGGHPVARQ